MSLWPRHKPVNQPKHFGRIGAQPEPNKPCPIKAAAEAAVRSSQFARRDQTVKHGARAVVRAP